MVPTPAAGMAEWDWHSLARIAHREARRVLINDHDAEDAAQNAIMRAFRARARCQTPDAPDSWIRTIARREALRLAAARPVRERTMEDVPDGVSSDEIQPAVDRLAAHALLGQVPIADRGLLLRRYVLDQTSSQIAADLSLPAATVRVRLHRALSRVREFAND